MKHKIFTLFVMILAFCILPIQGQQNSQIEETNNKIIQAIKEGNQAFNEKNYELAVKKYDEGYNLAPNNWEIATVFLTNKAVALTNIGVEKYNIAIKDGFKSSFEINQYFQQAVDSLQKAISFFEIISVPVNESQRDSYERKKYNATKQLAETYRIFAAIDKSKIPEAIKAYEKYIEIETDKYLKEKAVKELEKLKSGSDN